MNRNCDYTDEELTKLLQGAQADWEEAMRCLLKDNRLRHETTAYLLKEGASPQDAEEAYSEGIRVFFENIIRRKFQGSSSPKTYFIGICKNIWLDKKRGAWRKRMTFFENALALEKEHFDTPDRDVELESLKQRINQLLNLTNERCKELYWLEVAGFSQAEIAAKAGYSSTDNVKNTVYRCKDKLRTIIKNSPDWTDFFKNYLNGK